MHIPTVIKIRLLLLFSILSISSCENNECDVIPNVTVDFTINLDTPPFNVLQAFGNAVEVPVDHARYSGGFNESGIIVYRRTEDEFMAYDRTCTFDHGETIAVEVHDDEPIATCPECESIFGLASFGSPREGSKATCPLKEYDATFYKNRNDVRVVHFR